MPFCTINSIMKYFYQLLFIASLLLTNSSKAWSQKDQIPLNSRLEQRSEALLIKVGMVKADIPPKLRFGDFFTTDRVGKSSSENKQSETTKRFSFTLVNKAGDSAYIESSLNKEITAKDEGSIYLSNNIDKDNLWVILMPETPNKQEFSLGNMFLTNGTEEIEIIHVIGDPTGKTDTTAPKGIELYLDGIPLGAMQYYSGGSFSYRKYIWISNQLDPELQLIVGGIFSAIFETAKYFEDHTLTE